MMRRRRRVLGIAVALTLLLAGCGQEAEPARTPGPLTENFFEYLQDGKIVRADQSGDVVSEGQAYGMILALETDQPEKFEEIWAWTRENLQRSDKLISWRWAGTIQDAESASDADLDIAEALVEAGKKWEQDTYTQEGLAMAESILENETAMTSYGRILLAGSWESKDPWTFNPSYTSLSAFQTLGEASEDPRWVELIDGSESFMSALLEQQPLLPEWASINLVGEIQAAAGPEKSGDGTYGLNSARTIMRWHGNPDVVQALAGGISQTQGELETTLTGEMVNPTKHPVMLLAKAEAAKALGQDWETFVEEAKSLNEETPTYYGSAWLALWAESHS